MTGSEAITGLVLAGGLGRRMGGVDKGLQDFRGEAMVAHVVRRLAPQVDALIINANQNIERYAAFGHPVVADAIVGFAGPLAGLHAGLSACTTPLLVTSPCDSPFLPLDLVARLRAALERDGADLAVAITGDQPHPVFSLVRAQVLPGLTEFLEGGGRKVDLWYSALKVVEVPFDDNPDAFANINTLNELAPLAARPAASRLIASLRSRPPAPTSSPPARGSPVRSACRCATRWAVCSPQMSSRRSACRRTTTRQWTATRCATPTCRPTPKRGSPWSAPPTPGTPGTAKSARARRCAS